MSSPKLHSASLKEYSLIIITITITIIIIIIIYHVWAKQCF